MPAAPTTVTIGRDLYRTSVQMGAHTLIADEPSAMGGADEGPNPYDLLLAALGSCKVMTLRMYADRKGWPLESASVSLAHERRHAQDCERCDTSEPKLDHIDATLTLEGDLSDDQRHRLLEIADRCPVHRTVTSDLRIKTEFANA